jgi:hypothetical protein
VTYRPQSCVVTVSTTESTTTGIMGSRVVEDSQGGDDRHSESGTHEFRDEIVVFGSAVPARHEAHTRLLSFQLHAQQ